MALAVTAPSTPGMLHAAATSGLEKQGQGSTQGRIDTWKNFEKLEVGLFAKFKLCGKQVSRVKKVGHLTNSGMKVLLQNYQGSTLLRERQEKVVAA